jgi:hypothetical protein
MSKNSTPQNRLTRQPFQPFTTTGKDAESDALLRIAHALEYIAAEIHEVELSEHLIALSTSQSVYTPPD